MSYIIDFERIGRNHNVPSLTVESDDGEAIAEAVYRHARNHLASRDFVVIVDLDKLSGSIEAGRFGLFTLRRLEEVPQFQSAEMAHQLHESRRRFGPGGTGLPPGGGGVVGR